MVSDGNLGLDFEVIAALVYLGQQSHDAAPASCHPAAHKETADTRVGGLIDVAHYLDPKKCARGTGDRRGYSRRRRRGLGP